MNDILRRLPKVDLHCHLDGSVRPATAFEIGRAMGLKLPADTPEGLKPFVSVPPTCRSLAEFLEVFHFLYPLLRSAAAVERIAYELVEDCAAENIRHVEVRLAPQLQTAPAFDTDAVIEAVLRGLEKGRRRFGTTSAVIICLFRSHGPAQNRRSFETLKKAFKADASPEEPAVVAMDLAGDEALYPTARYAEFFEEAASLGIPATCHAGETAGTANLSAALALSVKRIGHGIHIMEDLKLMGEVVRRRIPLEIGLTSNIRTKTVPDLQSHPARSFHQAGVLITLNTDDRGALGIDLSHEYGQALKLGFSLAELARISAGAADHLFWPPQHRQRLKRIIEKETKEVLESARETL